MSKKTAEYIVNLCPLFQGGLDRCYHMQPDSRKVYLAITYCQNDYLTCDIYKELKDSELIANQEVKGGK